MYQPPASRRTELPADAENVLTALIDALNPDAPKFYWWPAHRERHAFWGNRIEPAAGSTGATLCGEPVTFRELVRDAWLWPSCQECWDTAKALRAQSRPA